MADDQTPGIRGPRGPGSTPGGTPSGGSQPGRPSSGAPASRRDAFERVSFPLLQTRWLVVVTPAILLFVGLVASGPFRWIGGLLLLFTAVLLGWLTALSWPRVAGAQKFIRVVIVLALVGMAVLKFIGRL